MTLYWKKITFWPPKHDSCMYLVRHYGEISQVTATATFGGWSHYIRITGEVFEPTQP